MNRPSTAICGANGMDSPRIRIPVVTLHSPFRKHVILKLVTTSLVTGEEQAPCNRRSYLGLLHQRSFNLPERSPTKTVARTAGPALNPSIIEKTFLGDHVRYKTGCTCCVSPSHSDRATSRSALQDSQPFDTSSSLMLSFCISRCMRHTREKQRPQVTLVFNKLHGTRDPGEYARVVIGLGNISVLEER